MDKAETEASVKPLSGGSDKSEGKQGLESLAGDLTDERHTGSRKAVLRPTRARRPGMKATARKQLLKDSAPKGSLDPLPKEPTRQLSKESYGQEPAEVCIPLHAEGDSEIPDHQQTHFQRKRTAASREVRHCLINYLKQARFQTRLTIFRMQIQETIGESSDLHQMPALSASAVEESSFSRASTHFASNLSEINRENSSLAQYLGLESCLQCPQQEAGQNIEGKEPGALWAESVAHELSPLEDNEEEVSQAPASVALPQGDDVHCRETEALSDAFSQPAAPSLPLENVGSGSRVREAACGMGFDAGDQETCYATMDLPVGAPADKYLPQEICPEDLELTEGQSEEVCDLCSPDKILAALQTQGSESPQPTHKRSQPGGPAEGPLFNSTFTWNTAQEASEDTVGETAADVGNSPSIFSSTLPYCERGLGETQPLCSFVNGNEGGYGSSDLGVPIAIDTLASYSSIRECSEEQSGHQVTREIEGVLTDATEVHDIKYHSVSVPRDNDFDVGADQVSCEARDEDNSQSLRSLSSFTGEAAGETLVPAPRNAGAHGHVSLLEGQGLYSRSLQIDNQPGYQSQTVEGAHSGGLEEDFQEKGSGTRQCIRPLSTSLRGSPSANDFQESLPSIPAMQQEANVRPLEHPLADSREDIECSSDPRTSVSVVAEKTAGDDSHLVSSVPALPDILLGEKDDVGLGGWAVGSKVKIITLEAPVFEIWPPELVTHCGYKEAEVGLMAPGRSWALSDILRAGATTPESGALGVATWVPKPHADALGGLGADRDSRVGTAPDRQASRTSLSSQCLGQPRLLESSVDPVEETELDVMDSPLEVSRTGEMEMPETMNEEQEETQQMLCHPAFVNQTVNSPTLLESSVDPIDDRGEMEGVWPEKPEPSDSNHEGNESIAGNTCQKVDIRPANLQTPHPQDSGGVIPNEHTTNQNHVDRERADVGASQPNEAKAAVGPAQGPGEERQGIPSVRHMSQTQDGGDRSPGEAGHRGNGMTSTSVKADTNNSTGHNYGKSEPRTHQSVIPMKKKKGTIENKCGKHVSSPNNLTDTPCTSSPKGNVTRLSISHDMEELKSEELQIAETKPLNSSDSPTMTSALISGECESEKDPESSFLRDPCPKGSVLESGKKSREEQQRPVVSQTPKAPGDPSSLAGVEGDKRKQEASGSGHLTAGIKKKILSRVAALRLRLEEKENVRKNAIGNAIRKKTPKFERSLSHTEEKRDPQRAPREAEGKAPVLLKKIQAEMAPKHSGNIKLSCQFSEIHEDSTVCWTKDSKLIAQVKKSAGDNSSVSLAIVQAGQKDQGLYYCCIKNSYGKVTAEFNLTAEVLKQLSSHTEYRGCEEIEFSQLIFKEDVFNDSYFGDHLRGQISTEEFHFGEGVHRKAFRSTVMQGLMPVFQPGHACVLKVHNAVAHGTRNNDELVQRNYKLAAQECYVQNTARYYAKIYAAEAQPLEGFGEVPEIIPIFLIRRPENNIPYATVEEELIGEFVKYSIRDGKEINFLRRDSEAGQKCCTFQHWVYQKTSGCLLVTDMQGVGMKLTDVGIATLARGYKGFKGNCSMTFIDQFRALHQCNKYCKMLGLKSLQNSSQKPKKTILGKGRAQTNSTPVKAPESEAPTEKKS
ncbi:Alpha-protein kinase 2 [Apodemus speciosus]|uniref:non-specific serine/threonine protein kinase n=1 Tax=Apodemus speciosus TaxID=105296 RepID=A0ABQ0FRE6_APOSI